MFWFIWHHPVQHSVLSHRARLGDCSVMQCIPLRQSKTDKTDKNLSFSSSTSAPAMQGGSYQSNARANKNDKNPFINILKSSLKFYLLKNSLCNRLWFMLFEPETKLNEVFPQCLCGVITAAPAAEWSPPSIRAKASFTRAGTAPSCFLKSWQIPPLGRILRIFLLQAGKGPIFFHWLKREDVWPDGYLSSSWTDV